MRTTLALDDELLAKAQAFTGLTEKSSIVREALKALIERESARRLAVLVVPNPSLQSHPDGVRNPCDPGRYVRLGRSFSDNGQHDVCSA